MPKAEKIERVAELRAGMMIRRVAARRVPRSTMSDITELRRSLAEGGATFSVVKNTLMQRAAADASIEDLEALLEGPTAVAFVAGHPVAAARRWWTPRKILRPDPQGRLHGGQGPVGR